jgi:hypothetical protein
MIPVIQIIFFLCKTQAGKNIKGIGKREGQRDREKLMKGVGDRASVRIGNGVG